jgi:hypothetical protein
MPENRASSPKEMSDLQEWHQLCHGAFPWHVVLILWGASDCEQSKQTAGTTSHSCNIMSCEAHDPTMTQKTFALSRCSDDGRVERKNDFLDFWLIVCPTDSVNGNSFDKQCWLSNVPFARARFMALK